MLRSARTVTQVIQSLAFVAFLLLFAMPAAAQSDITGFWVFRVPTPDGNVRESFFDLKLDGQTVPETRSRTRVKFPSVTAPSTTALFTSQLPLLSALRRRHGKRFTKAI